jgi:hypothetical protein
MRHQEGTSSVEIVDADFALRTTNIQDVQRGALCSMCWFIVCRLVLQRPHQGFTTSPVLVVMMVVMVAIVMMLVVMLTR